MKSWMLKKRKRRTKYSLSCKIIDALQRAYKLHPQYTSDLFKRVFVTKSNPCENQTLKSLDTPLEIKEWVESHAQKENENGQYYLPSAPCQEDLNIRNNRNSNIVIPQAVKATVPEIHFKPSKNSSCRVRKIDTPKVNHSNKQHSIDKMCLSFLLNKSEN